MIRWLKAEYETWRTGHRHCWHSAGKEGRTVQTAACREQYQQVERFYCCGCPEKKEERVK